MLLKAINIQRFLRSTAEGPRNPAPISIKTVLVPCIKQGK